MKYLFCIILITSLTSCGGGEESGGSTPTPTAKKEVPTPKKTLVPKVVPKPAPKPVISTLADLRVEGFEHGVESKINNKRFLITNNGAYVIYNIVKGDCKFSEELEVFSKNNQNCDIEITVENSDNISTKVLTVRSEIETQVEDFTLDGLKVATIKGRAFDNSVRHEINDKYYYVNNWATVTYEVVTRTCTLDEELLVISENTNQSCQVNIKIVSGEVNTETTITKKPLTADWAAHCNINTKVA